MLSAAKRLLTALLFSLGLGTALQLDGLDPRYGLDGRAGVLGALYSLTPLRGSQQEIAILTYGGEFNPQLSELDSAGWITRAYPAFSTCEGEAMWHRMCLGTLLGDRGGRVLLAGSLSNYPDADKQVALERYAYGQPDPTFADSGRLYLPYISTKGLTALLERSDGRLWAAGFRDERHLVVVRLLEDGRLDSTFAHGGLAPLNQEADSLCCVLEQADGGLMLAGTLGGRVLVVRLSPDGTLDPNFNGGKVWTGPAGRVTGMFAQPNNVVLTGWRPVSGGQQPFLLKLGARERVLTQRGPQVSFTDEAQASFTLDHRGRWWTAECDRKRGVRVRRFLPEGKPDLTFNRGKALNLALKFPQECVTGLVVGVQTYIPSVILAVQTSHTGGFDFPYVVVWRLNAP